MTDIYGKPFQEARLRVLERDGYRCRTCDHDGSIDRLEVHHRHYRDGANPKDEDLITLCVACHDLITNKMRGERYSKKMLTEDFSSSKMVVTVEVPVFDKKQQNLDVEDVVDVKFKPNFNKEPKNV